MIDISEIKKINPNLKNLKLPPLLLLRQGIKLLKLLLK